MKEMRKYERNVDTVVNNTLGIKISVQRMAKYVLTAARKIIIK